ncbi:MAG: hypothetical protein AB1546_08190 [bacterium]
MFYLLNEGSIRPPLIAPLRSLVQEVVALAEKNNNSLKCAALFGSVVGKDFIPKKSNINILLIFDHIEIHILKDLREPFKNNLPKFKTFPVVIDEEYIHRSGDVFPMEFLEWKEKHIHIYGDNLLRDIEVSFENLRLEVEENLRGKKLRLIQAYFEIATGKAHLQSFLETTLPNFLVVFRNLLRLNNKPVPDDVPAMLDSLSEICGVHFPNVKRLFCLKTEALKVKPNEAEILFKGYLQEITDVTRYVDNLKQLQGQDK